MRGAGPVAASLTLSLASYLPLCSGLVSSLSVPEFSSIHVASTLFPILASSFLLFSLSAFPSIHVTFSLLFFYISFFALLSSHISFQPSPCFSLSFPYWTFISRPTALSLITPGTMAVPFPYSLTISVYKSPYPWYPHGK